MLPARLLLLMFVAALFAAVCARGATIDVDTVLGPGHPYLNETITVVDGVSPPTVVQVIEGAIIGGPPTQMSLPIGLDVYGRSIVEVLGGFIRGREQSIFLHDEAQLRMSGGEIRGSAIELRDSSQALFHDGDYAFRAYGDSRVEVYGGDGGGRAYENARVVQRGGHVSDLLLYDNSTFVMHDGYVNFGLVAYGKSRTLKNGGGITFLTQLFDEAVVTIRGGNVSEDVYVYDDARLHLYGFGLDFEISEEGEHYVSGRLADGTRVQSFFPADHQSRIILHEVPEPATWAIFAVGFATLMAGGRLRCR
jgi:hypothetical protein